MSTSNEWWRRRASPKPTAVHPWRAVALEELSARAAAAWISLETGLLAWGTPVRGGPDGTAWAVVLLPDGDAGEPLFLRTLGECAPWFGAPRSVNARRVAPAAVPSAAQAQVRAVLDAVAPPPSPTAERAETEADPPIASPPERNADDREPAPAATE